MPMLDAHIPRAPPPEAEDKLLARPTGRLFEHEEVDRANPWRPTGITEISAWRPPK